MFFYRSAVNKSFSFSHNTQACAGINASCALRIHFLLVYDARIMDALLTGTRSDLGYCVWSLWSVKRIIATLSPLRNKASDHS